MTMLALTLLTALLSSDGSKASQHLVSIPSLGWISCQKPTSSCEDTAVWLVPGTILIYGEPSYQIWKPIMSNLETNHIKSANRSSQVWTMTISKSENRSFQIESGQPM